MLPKIPAVGTKTIRPKDLSKWVGRGWKFHKELGGSAFEITKRYSAWEQFEMRTRSLFLIAGFEHAIADVQDFHYTDLGAQIDVCGGIGNYFVVIDCTQSTRKHPISLKQKLIENHAKKGRILRAVNEKWPGKFKHLVIGVCVEGVEPSERDLIRSSELGIPIVDSSFMDKCVKYIETLGQTIQYQILGRLGVRGIPIKGTDSSHHKFPAMAIRSGEKLLYSFCADPESLLKLAYVYRLERFDEKGYQRDLIPRKLKNINDFLFAKGYFPNNLIVCFDGGSASVRFVDRQGKAMNNPPQGSLGYLKVPKLHSIAEVIDGQHRLYGYLEVDKGKGSEPGLVQKLATRRKEDLLNAVAIVDPEEEDRPLIFVDINSNQSRVNTKNIWALMGDIAPRKQVGFIANLVKSLNGKGPLKGKIYIPGKNTSHGRTLNIANLGKGIKDRNLVTMPAKGERLEWNLFDGDRGGREYPELPSGRVVKDINTFFGVIRTTCKQDWRRQEKGFILTNNGLNVMLRIFAEILKVLDHEGRQYRKSTLKMFVGQEIGRYIEEKTPRRLRGQTLGEDGRAKTAKEVWARLAKRNHLTSGA